MNQHNAHVRKFWDRYYLYGVRTPELDDACQQHFLLRRAGLA